MRSFKLPPKKEMSLALASFSKKERIIFVFATALLFLSTFVILKNINEHFMIDVPLSGGSLSEGIVGTPRFANPVLASTPADQDIVSLVYSGLMRKDSSGTLIPDLALGFEASEDGLTYTFTLKDDIYFHDGNSVTPEDVLYTINKVKDSVIKSPYKINWDGVTAEILDDKTVRFTLRQPYASFLENTTLGIMPAHIWGDSPIELNDANTNPVGSGPYMIKKISKQSSGIIEYYELVPFERFALGKPYIKEITLYFYPNEDEMIKMLDSKTLSQASSISPVNAKVLAEKGYMVESSVLPRVFGLFFNQSVNQLFVDKTVVKAINEAIDKDRIIRDVLLGYGVKIDSPIPPNKEEYVFVEDVSNVSREEILESVRDDLAKGGWKIGEDGFLQKTEKKSGRETTTKLEFSISTSNSPDLEKTAELIKKDLAEVGMKVDIKTFDTGNLNQSVIRPRKYDALLFGQIINTESDLFAFWHSSQRKDPGLNVALYTNVKVDKILEDAFITIDKDARIEKYLEFRDEIVKDQPAVFLYSPSFVYIVSKDLTQPPVRNINSPADRYRSIYSWYSKTEKVWKIFAK